MGSDTLAHGPSGQDCVDLFCTECFIKLHRKGKRRQHVHLTIDNTGRADDAAPIREAPRALLYRREAVHDASAHVWIHAQYSTVPYRTIPYVTILQYHTLPYITYMLGA